MKKGFLLSMAISLVALEHVAAQPLKTWDYANLDDIRFSAANGSAATHRVSPDVKTSDGHKTLEVVLTAFAPAAKPWDIQLQFIFNGSLKAGRNYEISFPCRASAPGTVLAWPALVEKPYDMLDKSTSPTFFEVSQAWKAVTLTFTAWQAWNGVPLAMPRMMLANYGAPATLYFGSASLRELPVCLPYSLDGEWTVFSGVKPPEHFDSIPVELSCVSRRASASCPVKGKIIRMTNDIIDLESLTDDYVSKDCAVLYKQFDSKDAGFMYIGLSADWFMDFYVNGEIVFSTMKEGNGSHEYKPNDHIVGIPVKAGRNILAVKVIGGIGGWKFICGKPTENSRAASLFTIHEGRDWKAIDLNKIYVKTGSALDFTDFFGKRHPASEMGRVIVNRSGHLAFEREPDKAVRFLGFNSGYIFTYIDKLSKKELDEFAGNIARQGYNIVRFQSLDRALCGGRDPKRIANYDEALQKDEVVFDEEAVDKVDYLFSRLKAYGVYFNLDLSMGRAYVMAPPWDPPQTQWKGGLKMELFFNPVHRKHWEIAIRKILSHRNPYTGVCLKDEPALLCVEPMNEQDLRLAESKAIEVLTPHFAQYLKDKYHSEEALRTAWGMDVSFDRIPTIDDEMLRRGDMRSADAGHFLIASMSELTKWYYKTIREAGYPGIITQWDMIMRTMEMPVRALMPAIAQHSYCDHPGKAPTKNLVKKSPLNRMCYGNERGIMKYDAPCGQASSLNSTYFRAAAAIRFLDRPFMMTEYSQGFFNRYRHERGLYFGAYAALQGWDALHCHGEMSVLPRNDTPLVYFENERDPIARASEVVQALAWLRGDVKEAEHSIQLNLSSSLFPKQLLSAIGDDYAKLSMLTKLGIVYPEVKPLSSVGEAHPTMALQPSGFSALDVTAWYVTASNKDGKLLPSLIEQARGAGILPLSNKTDSDKKLFHSETGELMLDGKAETMTVSTDRLEGAIIKQNKPVKLKNLEIESCSKPAAVTVASLDNNAPIESSKHLLLVFATNALNDGMIFENSNMRLMVEIGTAKILVETARLSLKLKTIHKDVEVYPLHLDGSRMEAIPAQIEDGRLALSVDTAQLPNGAVFFEIVLK